MTVYFVDDGGTPTAPYDTWAKAATSIQQLDTAVALASGDIVYIGADSNCTDAAAALTITGPASGLPVTIISSTVGSGTTVAYSVGTGNQILATGATSDITFDGSFALVGIKVVVGRWVQNISDSNEIFCADNCTFVPGSGGIVQCHNTTNSAAFLRNCVVDLSADSGTITSAPVYLTGGANPGKVIIRGMQFIGGERRSTYAFYLSGGSGHAEISGSDLTGFTFGTADCDVINIGHGWKVSVSNCKTIASITYASVGTPLPGLDLLITNVGPSDAPSAMYHSSYFGVAASSTSIYRTGGATVETEACSWLITTTANCAEVAPFYTPWVYGTTTNGTKTFTVYGSCNNAGVTTATPQDDWLWLEVEYLATADEADWTLVTDHRATITTAAADQTTETSSTWVGLNDSGQGFADFRFKLECASVSVGETGQYRARVAVGKASITSASYLYIDPLVTVS